MSEEILVNVTPVETRVAVVEQGVLQELHIERAASRGIAGNIYVGKVARVLPGMQAAFVDIGEERTAFIHSSDIVDAAAQDGIDEDIQRQLRQGQLLTVQVAKEPLGSKGARLTTELSMSTRYLVFLPGSGHIGISQQITDADERSRLKTLVQTLAAEWEFEGAGFIVRTAAEGVGSIGLESDLKFLARLWKSVNQRRAKQSEPGCIYFDWQLYHRAVRDLARPGLERVRVDDEGAFQHLVSFCKDFVPELEGILEHYQGERPLFDLFGVEEEIDRALQSTVRLKSGGHLVIEQTEAMTTVDVNTGGFVGRSSQEETVYKTNLEAASALTRQLRVRNIGGIVMIDFIDMQDAEHRRQVLRALEKGLARDSAKTTVSEFSNLGLVAMTRKRTRESLEHILCESCDSCGGKGAVKSARTVCYEIFRGILRDAKAFEADNLTVRASQEVVDCLLDEESTDVAELEEFTGKAIQFRVEPMYSREQFDIILL